jgi:hypothetical protein
VLTSSILVRFTEAHEQVQSFLSHFARAAVATRQKQLEAQTDPFESYSILILSTSTAPS